MAYQQQLDICRDLERENPRFVDYVLKPATDEMWNLIDGKRTIADIIDCSSARIQPGYRGGHLARRLRGLAQRRPDRRRFRLTRTEAPGRCVSSPASMADGNAVRIR